MWPGILLGSLTKAYVSDEASFNAPNAYKVIAVLDLDGDGKMEIVVGSHYYEGEETTIYRCDPKKVEPLLSVACGAGGDHLRTIDHKH